MTSATLDTLVSQLVLERPSRSRMFQRLGIDFCCGGKIPLRQAALAKGLDPEAVLTMLQSCDQPAEQSVNPGSLSPAALSDHIEQTHHAFTKAELPRLHKMLQKVAQAHGDRFTYMWDVLEVYEPFMAELTQHMAKEELVLFPCIRRLEQRQEGSRCDGTVATPIGALEHEHASAGAALGRMRALTNGFVPPAGACTTFRAALDGLAELERDMHMHVHKENNILFPQALELQKRAHANACS